MIQVKGSYRGQMQDGDHTDGYYITLLFAGQLIWTFEVLVLLTKQVQSSLINLLHAEFLPIPVCDINILWGGLWDVLWCVTPSILRPGPPLTQHWPGRSRSREMRSGARREMGRHPSGQLVSSHCQKTLANTAQAQLRERGSKTEIKRLKRLLWCSEWMTRL